jgi:hypothetical protein
MSLHQRPAKPKVIIKPKTNNVRPALYECANNTVPKSIKKAPNDTKRGHGLASTM